MRYQKVSQYDIANGPGVRTVLWVSGCTHHCPQCHNPETWDFQSGNIYNKEVADIIIQSLAPDYISGLTISGGDPLSPKNVSDIARLVAAVKLIYPDKSIWVYTGYTYEHLLEMSENNVSLYLILNNIDVLVDGRFVIDEKDMRLKYCGSRNQRVINMRETMVENKVVLYED